MPTPRDSKIEKEHPEPEVESNDPRELEESRTARVSRETGRELEGDELTVALSLDDRMEKLDEDDLRDMEGPDA